MDYLNKYLKYKSKYLKLKTLKGGNSIDITGIISFNILNPAPYITKITFKSSGIDNKVADQMGLIDEKRFYKYRSKLIIDFIKEYLKNNIVCLQEVNKNMLVILKKNFDFVYHTNGLDTSISNNNVVRKEEYRVIISPIELKTETIDLKYKQAIGCYINDKLIINVHLYINLSDTELKETLEILSKYKNSIIIGDFNREYNNELFNEYNKAHNDEFTFIHNQIPVKYDNAISKDIKLGSLRVIDDFNGKQILYNVEEMFKRYQEYFVYASSKKEYTLPEYDILEGNYLSDHKPIYLELP